LFYFLKINYVDYKGKEHGFIIEDHIYDYKELESLINIANMVHLMAEKSTSKR
jgi:hypothetical protein